MPSHDPKATGEFLEKLDCNGVTTKNGPRFMMSQVYDASDCMFLSCHVRI